MTMMDNIYVSKMIYTVPKSVYRVATVSAEKSRTFQGLSSTFTTFFKAHKGISTVLFCT